MWHHHNAICSLDEIWLENLWLTKQMNRIHACQHRLWVTYFHLSVHVYGSPSKSHLYLLICLNLFTSSVVHMMVLFILTVTANMHDKLMKVIKQYLLTNTTYILIWASSFLMVSQVIESSLSQCLVVKALASDWIGVHTLLNHLVGNMEKEWDTASVCCSRLLSAIESPL